MLKLNDFRNYITSFKDTVAEITQAEVVMDDSQINSFLKDQDPNTNIILGIIPKHNFGGNIDTLQSSDRIAILVVRAVDRKNQDQKIFLDTIAEMQDIAQKVLDKMTADYTNEESCSFMRYLEPDSIDVNPIWGLSGCDGYEIDFNTKTKY